MTLAPFLALGAMLAGSVFSTILAKHLFRTRRVALEWSVIFWQFLLPCIVFGGVVLWQDAKPVPPLFWILVAGALPFEIAGQYLQYRALRLSDVSLVTPFLSLTPLFLLGLGYAVSGDIPTIPAGIGVVFIAAGIFSIGMRGSARNYLSALRDPGVQCMIGTALAYSVTSAFAREAVLLTDPFTFGFWTLLLVVVTSGAAAFIQRRNARGERSREPRLWTLGVGATAETFGQYIAYQFLPASYVIALKRLATIFIVVWGGAVWKEPDMPRRLGAALIMITGAALIILYR